MSQSGFCGIIQSVKKLLQELAKLDLPADGFAIFGSGPMAIRNIRPAGDLDLIVTPAVWNALLKRGYKIEETDWEVTDADGGTFNYHRKLIPIGNIEVWRKWSFLSDTAEELIKNADIIDGVRFVKLEKVLEWKHAYNRPKDKADIKLIKEYLKDNEGY